MQNMEILCPFFFLTTPSVSLAVMYNFIFVIGRSCFWEMANLMPAGWLGKDNEKTSLSVRE